jgi:predicted DNA-binding protein
MADFARLSTRIDVELKEVLDAYVRRSRISQQDVVQMALAAWLEDAEDLQFIEERRKSGKFHSLEDAKRLLEL